MKLILLVVFLFSSLFDACYASELGQSSNTTDSISTELVKNQNVDCYEVQTQTAGHESSDSDSYCVHCLNCHLWNLSLPIQFVSPLFTQKHPVFCKFPFTSPSIDGPKRPPKAIS